VHIVTKVLVVFAAVLAVLLSALTMAYAVNSDRIVASIASERDQRQAVQTQLTQASAQAGEERAALSRSLDETRREIASRESKIRDLESERSTLRTQVEKADARAEAIRGEIGQLNASVGTLTRLTENYRDEVTQLRDNELGYRRREIELVDRINDLESQREVLEQSTRALQEQLAEARRAIETQGVTAGAAGRTAAYTPSISINGRVTNVIKDPATGKPMAMINVGANNSVRENMQLVITRNGQFVGNLIITRTDLQWSLGEIDYLGRKVEVLTGDIVQTLASR
jgi:small-conductance mechanosensitive channel